ncbi:MAG: NmrA/HSCARG family protein [Candidatus Heimdallarchaeota archaeon]
MSFDKDNRTITVIGATGNQGGAVTRHLVKNGWPVRAVTRDPSSDRSQQLLALGSNVELAKADLNDSEALESTFSDTYGVFSVQNFWTSGGATAETQQGKNTALAAKNAEVEHFVYSSVGSAQLHTGLAHFESKFAVEEYIRELTLPATIIRPVYFMENFLFFPDLKEGLAKGTLAMGLPPDRQPQLIALDDIGGIAAAVFEEPERYIDQALDIAGDEVTMPQVATGFSEKLSKPIAYQPVPLGAIYEADVEMGKMFTGSLRLGIVLKSDSKGSF